jgi:hypothetical protein
VIDDYLETMQLILPIHQTVTRLSDFIFPTQEFVISEEGQLHLPYQSQI